MLEGSCGSGKSTLVREIAAARNATVIDLDDEAVVAFVREDPTTALA
jgi:shikimate kinase